MSAIPVPDVAAHPAPRHLTGEPGRLGTDSSLKRWIAGRRRRRYLAEKRSHDARDLSDRYLDPTDDMHQWQALVAFRLR